jgi:CDP-diglyceride synthetase
MNGRSQRVPALVAAVAAVVLFLSLFADWYRLDLPSRVGGREIDVPTFNAFEGLERSDVALVVAAAAALTLAALIYARVLAESPALGLLLLGAGFFAFAVVVYRGSSRPARILSGEQVDTTLRFGWYVAFAAAAAITVAGLLAYLAGPRLKLEPDDALQDDEEPGAEPRAAP